MSNDKTVFYLIYDFDNLNIFLAISMPQPRLWPLLICRQILESPICRTPKEIR